MRRGGLLSGRRPADPAAGARPTASPVPAVAPGTALGREAELQATAGAGLGVPVADGRLLRVMQVVGRALFSAGFRLEVRGRELIPAGPLLIAGNHSGYLDGPMVVVYAPREVYTLAKAELYSGGMGRFLTAIGQIPVHRSRPDRRALYTALDIITAGGAVGVFPEGTRGSGELDHVQHGVAWLALRGNCPIVPVACVGTERALPHGAHVPHLGAKVQIVYGEPFRITPPPDIHVRSAIADAAEQIRVRLAEHLAQARVPVS